MKKITLLLAIAFFLSSFSVSGFGFDLSFKYNAKSGDKQLDITLGDINAEAESDPDGFITDMSNSYGVPKTEVNDLIYRVKMPFADAYMTIKIASLINKPISTVVKEYKANRGRGWGVIAKNLGIKPGSAAFHALKKDASVRLDKAKGRSKAKAKAKGKAKKNK
jgi:hypothetical protein